MYSANENSVLQQVKRKINELLPLVKELSTEDRHLVKKFFTEIIHEIFLVLDADQGCALNFVNNEYPNQQFNQHVCSKQNFNPLLGESSSMPRLSRNNGMTTEEPSEMSGFSSYKIETPVEESDTITINELTIKPCDNLDTNKFLPSQYLPTSVPANDESQVPPVHQIDSGTDNCKLEDNIDDPPEGSFVPNELDNDESTQQLMDEIDDIKPKSNLPFVKDGTPDTTCTTGSEDVSSLLSFLPQLSPYIKFDLRDSNMAEKEGYIHLTVERADGSVQNLKLAATTASPEECARYENDRTLKSNCGDKQLTLIQKDLMEKENDLFRDKQTLQNSTEQDKSEDNEPAVNQKARGRPRKQDIFNSKILENGQKVYVCEVCPATALSNHAMAVHMRRHSGEKPFTCEICAKSFTTKGNLKNHLITHSNEKPWACSYCEKTFKEKKVLITHERIHTGDKPFKCHLCEKSFTQCGVLKEHLLVHTGQKPHLCDLCGQEFRGLSSLRAHKLRHLQRKDFKCDKCEKEFICKADLTRHYLTHTGSRPFMCSLCPKSFTRLSYLKEHLNIHYGNKPYSCTECSAAFPDSISLHRHKRKHKTEKESMNKQFTQNQSELQKQLIMDNNQSAKLTPALPSFEIMQQNNQLGDQSIQLVLDENTTVEDIQKLQSLLSSTNSSDLASVSHDVTQPAVQPVYQVMCMNPDTQEIVDPNRINQVVGSSAYLSAINMLANATSQQYSFSIQ